MANVVDCVDCYSGAMFDGVEDKGRASVQIAH